MRAGMGIVSVAEDAGGKYYTLADGEILRPQSAGGSMLRARVTFDGTVAANITGTYAIIGTTCTVTIAGHGHIPGHFVCLDFTTGTGADATYTVLTVTENTYTVLHASATTSGNVTEKRRLVLGSGRIHSVSYESVGSYIINFLSLMPDAYYTPAITGTMNLANNFTYKILSGAVRTDPFRMTTAGIQVGCTSGEDSKIVSVAIFG